MHLNNNNASSVFGKFSFFTFFFIIIILELNLMAKAHKPGGKLYFEFISYTNDGREADGSRCEVFGGKCDPIFQICIDQNMDNSRCLYFYKETKNYPNTEEISGNSRGELANVFIKEIDYPVNPQVYVRITVREHDNAGSGHNALIAQFQSKFELNIKPNAQRSPQTFQLARSDGKYKNKASLWINLDLSCNEHRYGQYCENYCKPTEKNTCTEQGKKICLGYWVGPECDRQDFCKDNPCAKGAFCKSLADKYLCLCASGIDSPECYANYDFCNITDCINGAKCINERTHARCDCIATFYGPKCEYMSNVCHTIQCQNGGSCLINATGIGFCMCLAQFEGERCEMKITTTTSTTTTAIATTTSEYPLTLDPSSAESKGKPKSANLIIGVVISLFVVLCVVSLIGFLFRFHYKQQKKKSSNHRNNRLPDPIEPDYEVPMLSISPNSVYVSMNYSNNNIYEESFYEYSDLPSQPQEEGKDGGGSAYQDGNLPMGRANTYCYEDNTPSSQPPPSSPPENHDVPLEIPPPLPERNNIR